MLYRIEIPISVSQPVPFSSSWGSLFHAAFLELLPSSVVGQLHQQSLKPWSQYLYKEKEEIVWVVTALNDDMGVLLETVLLNHLPQSWVLRQKNVQVTLKNEAKIETKTVQQISEYHFCTEQLCRRYLLRFVTPTTFKTEGSHVLFPTTDLLMNSLLQRWDAFSDDLSIGDDSVREHLKTHVQIRNYRLSSASFSVDNAWIKGFQGTLDLYISGPDALVRLAGLLLEYARFSGVGVKTALGMGGVILGEPRSFFTSRNNGSIPG